MSWDVAVGLALVACGLALALWDREHHLRAPSGAALQRHDSMDKAPP